MKRRASRRRRMRLGKFFPRMPEEAAAPGAASAGRAGVGRLVLLGDPPFFDENDTDPHCCAWPQGCSCRAVACGDRGVSCDMGRRPLVRRRWRLGSPSGNAGNASPAPRPPRSPRQRRLRSRTPKSSRGAPRAFRRSREAAALPRWMPVPPVLTSRLHGASDPPPPRRFERVAHPCLLPVHLPGHSGMR